MRPFIVCLLAAVLPIVSFARQEACEEKIYSSEPVFGRLAQYNLQEKIPGWVFFEQNRIHGRIHGNTYWNIKGVLEEKLPVDELFLDSLVYTLNRPQDFEGPFSGTIGRGEIVLKWESGASIVGRAGQGDFEVKGKTHVEYSP